MAFSQRCVLSFCVNLIAINLNLYNLELQYESLEHRTNLTLHQYESLNNLLEDNVHNAIELAIHDLISNASKHAIEIANGLAEQAKSEGRDVQNCLNAFEKLLMLAAAAVVDELEPCVTDIEKKYVDLSNDIRTGIKNGHEQASQVKWLPSKCNEYEDEQEYQCFKMQLERDVDKQHLLGLLYREHEEKYEAALTVTADAIKCIKEHKEFTSNLTDTVLEDAKECIVK